MNDAARHFLSLLDQERQAACQADVDTLVSVQEEKARVLASLQAEGASNELLDQLAAAAEANIILMRHLVLCLRGLIEGVQGSDTYDASGSRANTGARGYSRGGA